MSMEKKVSGYLVFRLFLGTIDIATDILLSIHLLLRHDLFWGLFTLLWVGLGFLAAIIGVVAGRCRTGDSMSCGKFYLLCLMLHANTAQAFFQAGPQIVTQLAIFWSGVYNHDLEVFSEPGSPDWFWAWLEIFSPLISFVSLISTGTKYNQEPGPVLRQVSSCLAGTATALFRLFILSLLFKLAPLISMGVLLLLYTVTVGLYRLWGDGPYCIVNAYFSLFLPFGHTYTVGATPGYISSTVGAPEVERSRINQEALLNRITLFFGWQVAVSLLLLVPAITFLEVWLYATPDEYTLLPLLLSRVTTYVPLFVLLVLSLLASLLYFLQSLKAREAARTWKGLTPGKSLLSPSSVVSEISLPVSYSSQAQNDRQRDEQAALPPATATSPRPRSAHDARPSAPSSPAPRPQSSLYPSILPSAPVLPGQDTMQRPKPLPPGNRKCENEDCVTCAWLLEGPAFSSTITQKSYRFMTPVTCRDTGVIYLVTCRRCRKQYVGKTDQSLRERHYGHRREMDTLSSPLGKHFGEECGLDSWRIQIIDKCSSTELKRREGHWQHELGTLHPLGLNIRDEKAGGDK